MRRRIDLSWLLQRPIAHRGLHDGNHLLPENSLAAFQLALQQRYPIELDVRLSSDQQIVVFHDDNLQRMCAIRGAVADMDAADLTELYLAGSNKKIPLLTEVLGRVNGRVPLLIEIKNEGKPGALEERLGALLKGYAGHCAVQSFNPFSLGWFARYHSGIPRGQLSGGFKEEKLGFFTRKALETMIFNFKSKPDFIGFDSRDLPNKRISRLLSEGMPILAWTIRSEAEQKRIKPYCTNIIFERFNPSPDHDTPIGPTTLDLDRN